MGTKEIVHFTKLFRGMIKNATGNKAVVSEEMATGHTLGDQTDRAMDEREQALGLKLKGRERFYLKKVVDALERIQEGVFGTCQECEKEIELGRLYARPTATLCITCKENAEKVEAQILYHKKSHTHGQTFAQVDIISLPNQRSLDPRELKRNIYHLPLLEENKLA